VRLGRDRERAAAVEGDRAVVERAVDGERHADRDREIPGRCLAGQARECVHHAAQQGLMEEEVAAGVGRQPELRADRVLRAPVVRARERAQMSVGIVGRVGDAHLRHAHRDACEPVAANVEKGIGHETAMIACGPPRPNPVRAAHQGRVAAVSGGGREA
jgi:hypothetical protein